MKSPRLIVLVAAFLLLLLLALRKPAGDSTAPGWADGGRILPEVKVAAVGKPAWAASGSQVTVDVPLRDDVVRLVRALDRGVPVQLTVSGAESRTLLLRPVKLLADDFQMTLGAGDGSERGLEPQIVRTYGGRSVSSGGKLDARASLVVVDNAISGTIENADGSLLEIHTDAETGGLQVLELAADLRIGTCEHDTIRNIATTRSDAAPVTEEDWKDAPAAVLAVVEGNDPAVLNAGGVNPANGRLDKYIEPLPLGQNYALSLRDLISLIVLDKGSTGGNNTAQLTKVASEYLARMANVAAVHEHQLGVRSLVQELILTPNTAEFTDVPSGLSDFRNWVGSNRPQGTYRWNNAAKFDGTTDGAIGIAYVSALNSGSGVSINNRGYTHALVAHEMGHNMGSGHSSGGIMNPSIIVGSRDFFVDVTAGETAAKDIYDHSSSRLYGSVSMRHPEQIPFAKDDDRTTGVNTPHVFNPVANDANVVLNGTANSALTLEEVSVVQPLNAGTVEISGPNQVTFTPASGFQGISHFSYSVRGNVGNGGKGWLHKGDAAVQVGTWNANSLNLSLAQGQVFSMRPSGSGDVSIPSQPQSSYVGTSRDDRQLIIIRVEAGATGTDSFVFQKNGANSTVNITYIPVSEYLVATPDVFFADGNTGTIEFDPLVNDQGGGYRSPVSINPTLNGLTESQTVTYYFRKRFQVADPAAFTGLNLELLRDDGAVVYLNGVELMRNNMPTGRVGFETLASAAVGGADETNYFPFNGLSKSALFGGNNVLAVELHQSSATSSDASFDLSLTGVSGGGNTTLISRLSNWKYLDDGSDQGTAWRETGFTNDAEFTTVGYGGSNTNKHITTYFRRTFNVANAAAVTGMTLKVRRDDGIVVYLNGSEVKRDNMPTGTIGYKTAATAGASDDGVDFQTFALSTAFLLSGSNTLAVEIHQSSVTSSDITFDLELTGVSAAGTLNFVGAGSSWKYLDNGTNQGTAWRAAVFNDSGWAAGLAPLGYPASGGSWSQGAALFGFGDNNEATTLRAGDDNLALLPGAFRVVSATNLTPGKGTLKFNETRPFTVNGASTNQLTGRMSFTPANGATGVAQVEYVIEDGAGNRKTGSVIIVLPLVAILSPTVDDVILDISNGLRVRGITYNGGQPPLSGTVTPAWSVVSAPAGGAVVFENSGLADTVARFTQPGDYVIRLRGEDNGFGTSVERRVSVRDAAAGGGTDGLLAWWKLDETNGSIHADASGNGHTGTRVNSPAFTDGILNGALNFDGGDRYVNLNAHVVDFKDLGQGSISAWFQTNTGSLRTIFSASDGGDANRDLRLYIETGRLKYKLRGDIGTSESSLSSPGTVNDNEWHHAAVTVDAARNATLYLDGEVAATGVRAFFNGLFDIDTMSIGRTVNGNASAEPFRGEVDDLRVYQRALSHEEVRDLASILKNHAPLVSLPDTQPVTGAFTIPTAFFNPSLVDDGLPGGTVSASWQSVAGPGTAVFSNASALSTNVTFPAPGFYTLRLIADDGEAASVGEMQITYTGAGAGVPFALGIADQRVFQNAPNTSINLFDVFADAQDADAALTFAVTGNTNAELFDVVLVAGINPRVLVLDYATSAEGVSDITVRATDTGGLFVESTFRVTVENFRPTIRAQILTVAEDAVSGDLVGTIQGSDSDGDDLSFVIMGGNEAGAFVINQDTGELRVSPAARLDFETTPGYSLLVAVTDARHLEFVSTANVSINVNDVNEAPVFQNQFFSIKEGAAVNDVAGTLEARDPEGRSLTLAITGGNTSSAFKIENGILVVNNAAAISLAVTSQFLLTVMASDDGVPALSDTAEIRVTVSSTLIAEGAAARALVPVNSSVDTTWYAKAFNDAAWTAGTTGVGFDTDGDYIPSIGINVLTEMSGVNSSIYIRVPFTVSNPVVLSFMELGMKYDDGFVAYLNGQEILRQNAPAALAWNAKASAANDDIDAQVSERFDVSAHIGKLTAGGNVLAIHGLNVDSTSSDLLMLPELAAGASVSETATVALQPVISVTNKSAVLTAIVSDIGGGNPALTYVWGRSDAGDDPAQWEFRENLGVRNLGTFSHVATGLAPDEDYFFNVIVSNAAGTVKAGISEKFTTAIGDPLVMIPEGAPARCFVPTAASGIDGVWRGRGFDDGLWRTGSLAAGYENTNGYQNLIGLNFKSEMLNKNASIYVRVPFIPSNPKGIKRLVLRMKYDDGFVAWLNGIEVARRTAADGVPGWNAAASGQHPDAEALVFEDIDISAYAGLMTSGVNVLAVHGLNDGAASSDMLISPELLGYSFGAGPTQFYDTWSAENGLTGNDALTNADFDKDGLSNLAEYAFNSDPKKSTGSPLAASRALNGHLRVTYNRRTDAAERGLNYRIEGSSVLNQWQAATVEAVESVQTNPGGLTESVTVRVAEPFARVVVEYAP